MKTADVIVIGSGFGGSVVAARLAAAGKKVTLLERGPWRDTVATRHAGIENRKPLPREGGMFTVVRSVRPPKGPKKLTLNKNGYMEMWIGKGVKIPVTSNVGGGSHIWGAMMEKPKSGYWNGHAEGLDDEVLSPHYARLLKELGAIEPDDPQSVPNRTDHSWTDSRLFTPVNASDQPPMGILYPDNKSRSTIVEDTNGVARGVFDYSVDAGMFGSPNASKTTLDSVMLLPALKQGLDIRALHEVHRITKSESGYIVEARDLKDKVTATFAAPKVVLAAGTMNTNALLLENTNNGGLPKLPALGQGLGVNGDLIADWPSDGRDAAVGTPVHRRVKIAGHEDSAYIIVTRGEAPPVPGFLRNKARKKAAASFGVVAMSQDSSDGRFWMDKGRVRFEFNPLNSPSFAATARAFDALGKSSGRELSFKTGEVFSAHPCGGCRISDNPTEGVVDGAGRVHGCPGLYIADASVFPRSTGVPPSLSIAAWASHLAQKILAED